MEEKKSEIQEQDNNLNKNTEEMTKNELPSHRKSNLKYVIIGAVSLVIISLILIFALWGGDGNDSKSDGEGDGEAGSNVDDNNQNDPGDSDEDDGEGNKDFDNSEDIAEKEKNEKAYLNALDLLDQGDYRGAYETFQELGDYKDAKKQLSNFLTVTVSFEYQSSDNSYSKRLVLGEDNLPIRFDYSQSPNSYTTEYKYDENGRLVLQTETRDGNTFDSVKYLYDEKNLMTNKIFLKSENENEYRYDEYGRVIEQTTLFSYGDKTIFQYNYDLNDNITSMVQISYVSDFSDPLDRATYTYTYDDNGNLLTESYYSSFSKSYYNDEYVYDENDRLVKQSRQGEWFNYYYEYTYDENGYLISETYYHSNNGTNVTSYTNDENGRAIKAVTVNSKNQTTTKEFVYDDYGNVLQCTVKYYNGNIQTEKYEYKFVYIESGISEELRSILTSVG